MKNNLVKVLITDASGIGYAAGKVYSVEKAEYERLHKMGKCKIYTEDKTEKATNKSNSESR